MIRTGILLLVLLAVLAGCRGAASPAPQDEADLLVEIVSEPENPLVGAATLVITVRDAAGDPISDAQLNIRGDMTHAGMVPVLAEAERGENGVYRVPFEWTMSGDWIVEVTVTLPDGATVRRNFDFSVVSG